MVNAQEWLESNHPKETRKKITELDISYKSLESTIDLTDFVSLREFNCRNNKLTGLNNFSSSLEILRCQNNHLTNLDLTSCPNLIKLNCHDNLLNNLDFLSDLNDDKLRHLNMGDNNLSLSDLNPLRNFVQ